MFSAASHCSIQILWNSIASKDIAAARTTGVYRVFGRVHSLKRQFVR